MYNDFNFVDKMFIGKCHCQYSVQCVYFVIITNSKLQIVTGTIRDSKNNRLQCIHVSIACVTDPSNLQFTFSNFINFRNMS